MRITVDLDETMLGDLLRVTGESKKSPAIAKAVASFVKRAKAREFGQMIREGQFDYGTTHEAQERAQDRLAD